MTDAQKLIAGVLNTHYAAEYSWGLDGCGCGFGSNDEYPEHVAAEIDKALGGGLTQEKRTNTMSSAVMTTNYNTGETMSYSDLRQDSRWVSGWTEVTE